MACRPDGDDAGELPFAWTGAPFTSSTGHAHGACLPYVPRPKLSLPHAVGCLRSIWCRNCRLLSHEGPGHDYAAAKPPSTGVCACQVHPACRCGRCSRQRAFACRKVHKKRQVAFAEELDAACQAALLLPLRRRPALVSAFLVGCRRCGRCSRAARCMPPGVPTAPRLRLPRSWRQRTRRCPRRCRARRTRRAWASLVTCSGSRPAMALQLAAAGAAAAAARGVRVRRWRASGGEALACAASARLRGRSCWQSCVRWCRELTAAVLAAVPEGGGAAAAVWAGEQGRVGNARLSRAPGFVQLLLRARARVTPSALAGHGCKCSWP